MTVTARRYWIFDLDGTLSVPQHDFAALRSELGLPQGAPILEAIAALPPERATGLLAAVDAWEWRHADTAQLAPGVGVLISHLVAAGCRLGVLTRNRRDVALRTLAVIGLAEVFADADVIGRDEAAAKPSPEGIAKLLGRWQGAPQDAVMVGDFRFDLEAGRAAGVATVLVDPKGRDPWPEVTDCRVATLAELVTDAVAGESS